MFESEKQRIKDLLQNTSSKISLVVDCWSTRNGYSFHGILATFVDSDSNYQQVVLDLDVLEGSHDGKTLAKSVFKVLEEYGIAEKLLAVTSDNASNMDTMLTELASMLAQKNIIFEPADQRIRCLAHVINLACQAALKVLKQTNSDGSTGYFESEEGGDGQCDATQAISISATKSTNSRGTTLSIYGRIKKATNRIRKSNVLLDSLKHFCEANQLPSLQLLTDMPVRWNLTFKIFKRCLELRKALDATMRSDGCLSGLTLSESEWKIVEEMVKFLEPFNKMTGKTSKQHVPLMSMTAGIYLDLYSHLESIKVHRCLNVIHEESGSHPWLACDKLNAYYPKTDGLVYIMGIVLDPRCKFDLHKSVGYEKLVPAYKREIVRCWKSKYYKAPSTSTEVPETDDIIERLMKKTRHDSRDDHERYLAEKPCKLQENENGVLKWWKENESTYPNLAKMAKDFLGAAATGVPVECLFSMGTDLLTQKRLSMIAETIRCCLCLKAWLKVKDQVCLKERAEAVTKKIIGEAYD